MYHKTCPACGRTLPLSYFHPHYRNGKASYSWCRKCTSEQKTKAGYNHAYRRRRNAAGAMPPKAQLWALYELYCGRCAYCHTELQRPYFDHIIALSDGGTNDITNLVPCCRVCNSRKGAKSIEVWSTERPKYSPEYQRLAAEAVLSGEVCT